MSRFLHCADLHLDSPLRGLERYEGAPAKDMREATRRSFANIVDLALERDVDFVLIAGDVFDGDWLDFNTGLFFANQLRRMGDAEIRVFIVRGNHDALSKISKTVTFPKNVHLFRANKPETVIDEAGGFAIHGQSFATGAIFDDLAAKYPTAKSSMLNIGLLHTALSGNSEHLPYAPTSIETLVGKGYHYWALGHVHARETVRQDPWIVFPGNTQGRHAKELGPKGCMVVEGDADGIHSVEFVATDVARWEHLTIDATDAVSMEDLQESVQRAVRTALLDADDHLLALRLAIKGRTALHGKVVGSPESLRAEVCAWINEASGGTAWLEKLKLSVSPPLDLAALAARDDPFGSLLRRLDELAAQPEELAKLAAPVLSDIDLKIPVELRDQEDEMFKLLSPEFLAEAIGSARERLLAGVSVEDAQ